MDQGWSLICSSLYISQKLSNCLAHFYKCHLHQKTNNCMYPRIIQPIPSAGQQHSVDKMQCRTREGSSQKLQKVHALWWVSCPSLSLSWLKGENERTTSVNYARLFSKMVDATKCSFLSLDYVVNSYPHRHTTKQWEISKPWMKWMQVKSEPSLQRH